MRTILIILLFLTLLSCEIKQSYEKPFVIISKSCFDNYNYCTYIYQDKNGSKKSFDEKYTKYNIGDSIK